MQITSYYPNVSINTANPATEQARREMLRREPVEPVRELEKAAAERPLGNDERQRATNNASGNPVLYDANGKETETQQAVSGEQSERDDQSEGQSNRQQSEQDQQQQAEQREIRELQARDQEVRAHEQAHATVGGRYAGAPSYEYQQGPDGKRYAVGGEVQIDLAPIPGDPAATIQKMQQVKAAALAPAEPSSADRSVASTAQQRLIAAQAELIASKAPEAQQNEMRSVDSDNEQKVQDEEVPSTASSDAAIVLPQRERLELPPLMAKRSQVIENFYQLATEPAMRPLRLQV